MLKRVLILALAASTMSMRLPQKRKLKVDIDLRCSNGVTEVNDIYPGTCRPGYTTYCCVPYVGPTVPLEWPNRHIGHLAVMGDRLNNHDHKHVHEIGADGESHIRHNTQCRSTDHPKKRVGQEPDELSGHVYCTAPKNAKDPYEEDRPVDGQVNGMELENVGYLHDDRNEFEGYWG